jgi:hypothetical protein
MATAMNMQIRPKLGAVAVQVVVVVVARGVGCVMQWQSVTATCAKSASGRAG